MAESTGFAWIIALITTFVGGLLWVVFNHVRTYYLAPIAEDTINMSTVINSSQKAFYIAQNAKFNMLWDSLPFIIVILICAYMFARSLASKEQ